MSIDELLNHRLSEIIVKHTAMGYPHVFADGLAAKVKGYPIDPHDPGSETKLVSISQAGLDDVETLIDEMFAMSPKLKQRFPYEYLENLLVNLVCSKRLALTGDGAASRSLKLRGAEDALLKNEPREMSDWYIVCSLKCPPLESGLRICGVDLHPNSLDILGRLRARAYPSLKSEEGTDIGGKRQFFTGVHVVAGSRVRASCEQVAVELAHTKVLTLIGAVKLVHSGAIMSVKESGVAGFTQAGERSWIILGDTNPVQDLDKAQVDKTLSTVASLPLMIELSRIADKEHKREYDHRILNSVFWHGRALELNDRRESILDAVIGLETLFLEEHEHKKASRVANRASWLLSASGNFGWDLRPERVREVYNLRNRIAHEGETDVSKRDVNYSIRVLRQSIIDLLSKYDEVAHSGGIIPYINSLGT